MKIGNNFLGIFAVVFCFVVAVAFPRYWYVGVGLGVIFVGWLIYQFEYK